MPAIYALSQQYGFKIIEDASHAIGASYGETPFSKTTNLRGAACGPTREQIQVGSCNHSDVTVFSFHPVKIITTGEGGMALTNDNEVANRMRYLRGHGIINDKNLMHERPENEIWNYQQIELGFNYRMTDIQAALGLSQMSRLSEYITLRHKIAKHYHIELASLPITTPWQSPTTYSSYHLYPIRINEPQAKKTQRQIYSGLKENGIAANLHYIPVHRHPYYENLGFRAGDFPEAEKFYRETISLPMYPTLTPNQQEHVIDVLRKLLAS